MPRSGRAQRVVLASGLAGAALVLLPGATATADLSVEIANLRSTKGLVRVCLTADPTNFPACIDDADAVTRSVPAAAIPATSIAATSISATSIPAPSISAPSISGGTRGIRFDGLPYGDYAVAVIHDENGNRKLDTFVGVPREGFGFSRNPPVGFGPPRFAAARFTLGGAGARGARVQYVRMRYLL